jgi:ribose transport system substrate-binding protein
VRDKSVLAMLALALAAAIVVSFLYLGDAEPARDKEKVAVIFKTPGSTNAFWTAISDGIESGAQDFGLDAVIRASRDETYVDEQIRILRDAVAERPAAIVLAAADYHRLDGPVHEAKARGIKVVCIDSFIASKDADTEVGTDNFEAGQKCGAALLRRLPTGFRVAVMSYVQGSSTAIGRESGLRASIGDEAVVVGTSYSSSDAEIAYAQAKAILAKESGLGGIAALNLPTLLGAARALAESDRRGRIVLVGVDSSNEVMKYIEQGVISDVIVQKPFNMGYISMAIVRSLIDGVRVKPYTNTGSVDIDKANMFDAENQKLLFPAPGK